MNCKKILHNNCVCLPEIFEYLGFHENELLDVSVSNLTITIRKSTPTCFVCNNPVQLVRIHNKHICCDCIQRLQNAKAGQVFY